MTKSDKIVILCKLCLVRDIFFPLDEAGAGGFRSPKRKNGESTGFPRELSEFCAAHVSGSVRAVSLRLLKPPRGG